MLSAKLRNKVVGRAPSYIVNGPLAAENKKNSQKATGQNVCGFIAISGDALPTCKQPVCMHAKITFSYPDWVHIFFLDSQLPPIISKTGDWRQIQSYVLL